MVKHTNFFESLNEAHRRLLKTVVMYDSEPFYIFAITNHKNDGIFRVYMEPVGSGDKKSFPSGYMNYGPEDPSLGSYLDIHIESYPSTCVVRKMANSPHFNKYRPFPLGMCNENGRVTYIERQPVRQGYQGLTSQMCQESPVTLNVLTPKRGKVIFNTDSAAFRACITGEHPSARESIDNLLSGEYENESVAFHREFAFVKGPVNTLFLAYKADVIGILPKNNFDYLRLDASFRHAKEAVDELRLFSNIVIE